VNSARGTVVLRSLGYKDAYSLLTDLGAIPPMDPPSMAAITFQRNHTDHELEMARLLVQGMTCSRVEFFIRKKYFYYRFPIEWLARKDSGRA